MRNWTGLIGRSVATAAMVAVAGLLTFGSVPALAQGAQDPVADSHYCDGCQPPLVYRGGPVLGASADQSLVVTPIYWEPPGASPYPDGYQSLINRYIADVAAASGTDSNVYSVTTEYYQMTNGAKSQIRYQIDAGTPVVDPAPLPSDGCTPHGDSTSCITDAQLRDELTRLVSTLGLQTGLGHFYPVFLPPNVETEDSDGTNSASSFCGYHRSFGSGSAEIVYGNEPFVATNCDAGQAPNGNIAADGAISTLSHELSEAITDPNDPGLAWNDGTSHEIGDICANDYGTPLGSTDSANPKTTAYNQLINGHPYYTQTEFSNNAFQTLGPGNGCAQSEGQISAAPSNTPTAVSVSQVFSDATPSSVAANGTSAISVTALDDAGNAVPGDQISYSTYTAAGQGNCGTLSTGSAVTDTGGHATATYTGGTDSVVCAVVAVEALGGRSATSLIYQGDTQSSAPTASDTFPRSIEAGGAASTFSTTFTNRSANPIRSARIEFDIYPASNTASEVKASQIHLSYSTAGSSGASKQVDLSGTTGSGGIIYGYVGPLDGVTIAPHSTTTVTYHLDLASSVKTDAKSPLISVEAFLDQVNTASGSGTTLADTYATDVKAVAPAPFLGIGLAGVLIVVGIVILVGIVFLIIWLRRRRATATPDES